MEWLKNNWDKVAALLLAIVGSGGIAMFLDDFVAMCLGYPWQAAFLAALSFAIGAFASIVIRRCGMRRAVAEKERQTLAAELAARRRRAIKDCDPSLKALMKVVVDKGEAFARYEDWRSSGLCSSDAMAALLEAERLEGGIARITATDTLRRYVEEYPDLFSSLDDVIEKHCGSPAERGFFVCGYGDEVPYRWWSRDAR